MPTIVEGMLTSAFSKAMKNKRTKLTLILPILGLVAGFGIYGFLGGCVSQSLPLRLTEEERTALSSTHIRLTVGIEEYEAPVYSEGLVTALAKTDLFDRVDHLENFPEPPDLMGRIERRIYGTATIPILTGISLGFIPTTVEEDHGFHFSLSNNNSSYESVPVRYVHTGPTTLGWWAVILNISPNRAKGPIKSHPRFIESLAWEIVKEREKIEALNPEYSESATGDEGPD